MPRQLDKWKSFEFREFSWPIYRFTLNPKCLSRVVFHRRKKKREKKEKDKKNDIERIVALFSSNFVRDFDRRGFASQSRSSRITLRLIFASVSSWLKGKYFHADRGYFLQSAALDEAYPSQRRVSQQEFVIESLNSDEGCSRNRSSRIFSRDISKIFTFELTQPALLMEFCKSQLASI